MSGIWKDNRSRRTLDTQTGNEYPSRNQTGVAIAPECRIDPSDTPTPWYKILHKYPGRFKDVATGETIGADGNLIE